MGRALLAIALAACVVSVDRAADRPWTIVHSPNLTLIGQQPAKTLRTIAAQIEQFRSVLGALIATAQRPLPLPTVVYVFGTHQELAPFLPGTNGTSSAIAGYFHPDHDLNAIALQLETFDDSSRIVFHEYTHLLLHNATVRIPLWLDEGLAEYYSTYALERDGTRANIGKPIVWHVAILRQAYIPIATLLAVDHSSPMYNERDRQTIFYAEAWALTHYLMTRMPGGADGINRYVTGIAKGGKPDEVFAQAFGKTPAEIDKELRSYIHGYTFDSKIFTFRAKVEAGPSDEGRALAAAEASARLGDLQRRVGHMDDAAARIESAVAAMPDAAVPQLAAALLRLDQKQLDAAWPALERAVTLAPDDFWTQLAYGQSVLYWETDDERRAFSVLGSPNPRMERALASLTKASVLNPSSAEVFALRAYAEMRTPGRLKDAAASIRRAMQLAPGRLDYVLRYADVYILAGRLADARTILTDVSRVTTDPESADAASGRLAELERHEASLRAEAAERAAATEAYEKAVAAAEEQRRARDAELSNTKTIESAAERERPNDSGTRAGRPRLRAVQRGEERAYGDLVAIECSAAQVGVHLKVGGRTIVATAKWMEDITLTEFLGSKDFTVVCGRRTEPDAVYVTWRSAPHRTEGGATIVGQAVAIEFVPRGFTP